MAKATESMKKQMKAYYRRNPEKWAQYRKNERAAKLARMTPDEIREKLAIIEERQKKDRAKVKQLKARLAELEGEEDSGVL